MGIFTKFLSKIKVAELLHKPDLDELANELIAADIGADLAHAIIEQTRKLKSATPEESLQTVLLSHLSKKSALFQLLLALPQSWLSESTAQVKQHPLQN